MKIFGWVQGKFNGKQTTLKKLNPVSATSHNAQEEFNDWPQGLLAIGTFGNDNDSKQLARPPLNSPPPQDHLSQENEEMEKLHREFITSLHYKHDDEKILDEFYNFPIKLDDEEDSLSRNTDVVLSRGPRENFLDNTNSDNITKRSFSFLFKKMLVCRSGFVTSSLLRDKLPESRMEKALLNKKIYPHNTSNPPSTKKYLANRHVNKSESEEDEVKEKMEDGFKWVKTDSEYIVLEI